MPPDAPYYDIYPDIGITSTPVIDIESQAIFVVAKTRVSIGDEPGYIYSFHALDLRDGSEKNDGPVTVDARISLTEDLRLATQVFPSTPFLR